MLKLNVGCGTDYKQGWVNVDISRDALADHYMDIRKDKYPYRDNSIEEIYCSGVLEQILTNEMLVHALNEMHRVLQSDHLLKIIVPNSKYSITFRDPFDCRHFLPETFNYLKEGSHEYENYGKLYGFKPWKLKQVETNERGIMTVILIKP